MEYLSSYFEYVAKPFPGVNNALHVRLNVSCVNDVSALSLCGLHLLRNALSKIKVATFSF